MAVAAPEEDPGRTLAWRMRIVLTASILGANAIGVLIVVTFATLVLPLPDVENNSDARLVNAIATGAYLLVVTPFGVWWGLRRLREAREWLEEDRTPDAGGAEDRPSRPAADSGRPRCAVGPRGTALLRTQPRVLRRVGPPAREPDRLRRPQHLLGRVPDLRASAPPCRRARPRGRDRRAPPRPRGDDAHPDRVRPRRGPTAHRHDDDRDLVPGRAGLQRSTSSR